MRNSFNIDRYLDEAEERFSGFYGDDYDDFLGDDFDLFEGDDLMRYSSAEGGGINMLKTPAPYQLTVANTTAGSLTLGMFGYNQYLLSSNFGSSAGLCLIVTISPIFSSAATARSTVIPQHDTVLHFDL